MADLTSAVLWDSFSLCRYPYRSRKPCAHIRHYSLNLHLRHADISEHHKQSIFGNEVFVTQTQQQSIPTWALIEVVRSICCSLHETGRSVGRCGPLCLWNALEDGLYCVVKTLRMQNDHPERKKAVSFENVWYYIYIVEKLWKCIAFFFQRKASVLDLCMREYVSVRYWHVNCIFACSVGVV